MTSTRNSLRAFDGLVTRKLLIYVYALIDPRTRRVFYVGKGGGNIDGDGNSRLFSHFFEAESHRNQSKKVLTIREIWEAGLDVEWQILRCALKSVDEAFHAEAAIIDALALSSNGRPDNDIDGHGKEDHGWRLPAEVLAMGAANVNPELPGRVFVFPIHNAIREHQLRQSDWATAVYESTRQAWSLGEWLLNEPNSRAVGIIDNISFGAYSIDHWQRHSTRPSKSETRKPRQISLWEFFKRDDEAAAELQNKNWQHILGPEAKYRMRAGGVIVVEFRGAGRQELRYLRPSRESWQQFEV